MDQDFVVTWRKSETTLLKPTSFVDELWDQVENISIEFIREFFITIQQKLSLDLI